MKILSTKTSYIYYTDLKDKIIHTLSSLEQRVIVVAAAVLFSCIAGYVFYRKYFFKIKKINTSSTTTQTNKTAKKIIVDKKLAIGSLDSSISTDLKPKMSQNQKFVQTSYQTTNEVDSKKFNKYLFSNPKLLQQNKTLLENTVCQRDPSILPIRYHSITPTQGNLDDVLHERTWDHQVEKCNISYTPDWFDYTKKNHYYIDFAHATHFGGGYRSYGCVQEERMFAEFPDLAILDFKTKNGVHPCVDSYTKGGHKKYPPIAKPAPFIIEKICRQFDVSKTPYALKFKKATDKTIKKGIVKVETPVPVNIVGLAAVDWRGIQNPKYKLADLTYHFEAAYLANSGALMISKQKGWKKSVMHTAPWGCGAFLNSQKMITAIQYLAARKAGIDLVFHGISKQANANYTKEKIDEITGWMSKLIEKNHSVHTILSILLKKAKKDPTWSPKL